MELMDFFMIPNETVLYFIDLQFIYLSVAATFCAGHQNKEIENQMTKMDINMYNIKT